MKLLLKVLLALLPILSRAQTRVNYNQIDDRIMHIPAASPDSLAYNLTSPYKTDREKVRAIFRWISENISYPEKGYHYPALTTTLEKDDTGALKPLNERVAELVLSRKSGVCDGYARLFKTLCDYAGITSALITGYADGSMGRLPSKFKSNHKWNAVFIDSTWYLLDPTWASGYSSYTGERFIKDFNERYFLAAPEDFIRDHYPEDLQYTFLPNPPVVKEFRYSPFKTTSFFKNYITAYKPSTGIIEASPGDTLKFEIETDQQEKKMWIVDTTYTDSAVISAPAWQNMTTTKIDGRKVSCTYTVSAENAEWISIILNDEVVMRYRLNVRKNFTVATTGR